MPDVRTPVRPLLKWAGGKRQLLPELRPFYPKAFRRYFEPFLGSGAVFLDLHNAGLLDSREAWLSDINADIVGCYRAVRDDVDGVIAALRPPAARITTGSGTRRSTPCAAWCMPQPTRRAPIRPSWPQCSSS